MGVIIGFITGNKNLVIGVIVLALLAGVGIYIKILKSDVSVLKAEKTTLKTELEASQSSVKSLQQAISDQNTAVQKLKDDADTRVASHVAELQKAKVISDNYKNQAAALLKRQAPQNTTKCDAANVLINEEIRNGK